MVLLCAASHSGSSPLPLTWHSLQAIELRRISTAVKFLLVSRHAVTSCSVVGR